MPELKCSENNKEHGNVALGKPNFSCLPMADSKPWIRRVSDQLLPYFATKIIYCGYSLEAPRRLGEALLMSTHNICFCGEIRKIFIISLGWKVSYLELLELLTSMRACVVVRISLLAIIESTWTTSEDTGHATLIHRLAWIYVIHI